MTSELDNEMPNLNSDDSAAGEGDFVTEEKKPINRTALVLFGILVVGGLATYLMYVRSGPKAADAATTAQVEAANKTISKFLDGGAGKSQQIQQLLASTKKIVQEFLSYPAMSQVPLAELQTNPFRHSHGELGADAAQKSRSDEKAEVLRAVQQLQLQSILTGSGKAACMMNNAMYTEGQQIESFTIEKIGAASVIVRNGQYRFELKMQR